MIHCTRQAGGAFGVVKIAEEKGRSAAAPAKRRRPDY